MRKNLKERLFVLFFLASLFDSVSAEPCRDILFRNAELLRGDPTAMAYAISYVTKEDIEHYQQGLEPGIDILLEHMKWPGGPVTWLSFRDAQLLHSENNKSLIREKKNARAYISAIFERNKIANWEQCYSSLGFSCSYNTDHKDYLSLSIRYSSPDETGEPIGVSGLVMNPRPISSNNDDVHKLTSGVTLNPHSMERLYIPANSKNDAIIDLSSGDDYCLKEVRSWYHSPSTHKPLKFKPQLIKTSKVERFFENGKGKSARAAVKLQNFSDTEYFVTLTIDSADPSSEPTRRKLDGFFQYMSIQDMKFVYSREEYFAGIALEIYRLSDPETPYCRHEISDLKTNYQTKCGEIKNDAYMGE